MFTVRTEKELKAQTKRAKAIYKQGLNPGKIAYSGPLGNYTMVFDGRQYQVERLPYYAVYDVEYLETVLYGRS